MELTHSLFILLNISYNSSNYPAFHFANTVCELVRYIRAPYFIISSTAKFILSNLHEHLDCEQLLTLELEEKEIIYCVQVLKSAITSPDFTTEGFSVHELLQILGNFTHPSYCTVKSSKLSAESHSKKIESHPKKKEKPKKLSYFDQKMLEVAEKLAKNCFILNQFQVIPLLEECLSHSKFQGLACRLLWNLLHQRGIKKEMDSNYPNIYSVLDTMKAFCDSADQLICHCCLWLLGKANEKGKYR